MKTLNLLFLILFIASPLLSEAIEASKDMKEFNVKCPVKQLREEFDNYYHECNVGYIKKDGGCPKFLELFWKFLPEYDCQRPFDKTATTNYVVPALWLLGAAHEDYIKLLWTISSNKGNKYSNSLDGNIVEKAQELFASKQFRNVLDGETAEEYLERSEKLEAKLKKAAKK